jgi:hypothetical protein
MEASRLWTTPPAPNGPATSAAIAAQQTPEVAKEVAAFAAASNLITTTIGTYFTLFVSLPFANWSYGLLAPVLGRIGLKPRIQSNDAAAEGAIDAASNELSPAGRAIAKEVPAFRRLGWPIVVASLMANAGTFLGAALIAQTFGH